MNNRELLDIQIAIWFVILIALILFVIIMFLVKDQIGNLQDQIDILEAELALRGPRP